MIGSHLTGKTDVLRQASGSRSSVSHWLRRLGTAARPPFITAVSAKATASTAFTAFASAFAPAPVIASIIMIESKIADGVASAIMGRVEDRHLVDCYVAVGTEVAVNEVVSVADLLPH